MTEYTGPIEGLTDGEKVNTILYRLAKAMGYNSENGVITVDADDLLDNVIKKIELYDNSYYYPN